MDTGNGTYSFTVTSQTVANVTYTLTIGSLASNDVAVNYHGMVVVGQYNNTNNTAFVYTTDGTSWQGTGAASILGNNCFSIVYNGIIWVAGGGDTFTSYTMAYSTDGVNWNPSTSGNSILTSRCTCVAWNGTIWVACGYGSYQLAYSSDGITWTGVDMTSIFEGINSLAWGQGKWVAGGTSTNNSIAYATDVTNISNWTVSTDSTFTTGFDVMGAWYYGPTVKYSSELDLWVAGNGHHYGIFSCRLAYSEDGISWTASSSGNAILTDYCSSIYWNGNKWLACGGRQSTNHTGPIAYSTDGMTWYDSTDGYSVFGTECKAVFWSPSYSLWFCSGNNVPGSGQDPVFLIGSSEDGDTWTGITDADFGTLYSNTFGGT